MISIKKILIVSWKGISQSVIEKNFINSLTKNYKIYFLDASKILNSNNSSQNIKNFKKIKNLKEIKIKKFSNLKDRILKIKPDIIVPYFIENNSKKTEKVFSYLKSLNIPLLKILDIGFTNNFTYYSVLLKHFFYKKINYDYLIHIGLRNSQNFYRSKNNIFIHHYDYEKFLSTEKKSRKYKKDYAVFLDENFVFHPDLIKNKNKNWIDPNLYFPKMINFFNFFEKNFHMKIIIASHPTLKKNFFKNFKSYHNNTCDLVRNAKFVFLHQSTSLNYPILFKKKILFLTSDEINRLSLGKQIRYRANYFNKNPINLDRNLNKKAIRECIISKSNKYYEYINLFLKHPKSLKNNFINIFNEYFNEKKV